MSIDSGISVATPGKKDHQPTIELASNAGKSACCNTTSFDILLCRVTASSIPAFVRKTTLLQQVRALTQMQYSQRNLLPCHCPDVHVCVNGTWPTAAGHSMIESLSKSCAHL